MGTSRRFAAAIAAAGIAVGGLTACSGSSSPSSEPTATPTMTQQQAEAAIKAAYATLFAKSTTTTQKTAVLQDGDQFTATINQLKHDPNNGKAHLKVTSVAIQPDGQSATVLYQISLGKTVVIPAGNGQAVLVNGTWVVSKGTFCGLIEQTGQQFAPCQTAASTPTPSS